VPDVTTFESTSATVLVDGLGWTEGPAVVPTAGTLLFTSMTAGKLYELRDGRVTGTHDTGGGPTGVAVDADGTVYVVQCSGIWGAPSERPAGLFRLTDAGLEPARTKGLQAPNDVCFGPDGRIYLTDPVSERALTEPEPGSVFAWDPASERLETMADGLLYPNGLAFDGADVLHVAETLEKRILRYPTGGATLGEATVFAELPAGPDGIAFDADGNLWACMPPADEVHALAPDGRVVARLRCGTGSMPSNCCFAADGTTLYVTAGATGALMAFDVGVAGLGLHSSRGRASNGRGAR
jgi:gluconolactonase